MRPMRSVDSFVSVAGVALSAFFGFVCAPHDLGDLGVSLRPSYDHERSPDEAAGAAPVRNVLRRPTRPRAWERLIPPGLLDAVAGDLRLLIGSPRERDRAVVCSAPPALSLLRFCT